MSPAISVLSLGLALAAFGCGGGGASGVAPRMAPEARQTVTLGAGETIGPVRMAAGDTLAVHGRARLGTGRSWRPVALPAGVSVEPRPTRSASGADGGEDLQAFALTAATSGEARVQFVYGVPWADAPEADCVLLLEVR